MCRLRNRSRLITAVATLVTSQISDLVSSGHPAADAAIFATKNLTFDLKKMLDKMRKQDKIIIKEFKWILYFEQTSNFNSCGGFYCVKVCIKDDFVLFNRNVENTDKIMLNGKMPVRFMCYLINQFGLQTKSFYSPFFLLPPKNVLCCFLKAVFLSLCCAFTRFFCKYGSLQSKSKSRVHNIDKI